MKVVLGGPYNSGLLAGGTTFNYEPAKADMVARANSIRTLCARHDIDIKAAALQFCAAHPAVAAVIPGPRSAAEVEQNARLMQAPIPGALWADLRRAGLLPESAPTPKNDPGRRPPSCLDDRARRPGWMSPDLSIARDYGLDDLRPLLGSITATVLVQAADSEAETAFMLDVAHASAGLVQGVVGWTNLAAPVRRRVAELAARHY